VDGVGAGDSYRLRTVVVVVQQSELPGGERQNHLGLLTHHIQPDVFRLRLAVQPPQIHDHSRVNVEVACTAVGHWGLFVLGHSVGNHRVRLGSQGQPKPRHHRRLFLNQLGFGRAIGLFRVQGVPDSLQNVWHAAHYSKQCGAQPSQYCDWTRIGRRCSCRVPLCDESGLTRVDLTGGITVFRGRQPAEEVHARLDFGHGELEFEQPVRCPGESAGAGGLVDSVGLGQPRDGRQRQSLADLHGGSVRQCRQFLLHDRTKHRLHWTRHRHDQPADNPVGVAVVVDSRRNSLQRPVAVHESRHCRGHVHALLN